MGFFSPNQTDDNGERNRIDNDTQIGDIVKSDNEPTKLFALSFDCRCVLCGMLDTPMCKLTLYESDILCPDCIDELDQCTNMTEDGVYLFF